MIRRLEEEFGRPLYWLLCLPHAFKLLVHKYMSFVYGGCTTGPSISTDVVSMELFTIQRIYVLNFKPIDGKVICVSNKLMTDLSTDQLYLLKACLAVQHGFTSSTYYDYLELLRLIPLKVFFVILKQLSFVLKTYQQQL